MKCSYPECKKEHSHTHFLEITNKEGSSVKLPFCDYHFYIVMGGNFKAEVNQEDAKDVFKLIGPFEEVGIAEQVIGAREMIAKLKFGSKRKIREEGLNKK